MSYGPWGRKESDMTERLTHTHTHTHTQSPWGCKELDMTEKLSLFTLQCGAYEFDPWSGKIPHAKGQ